MALTRELRALAADATASTSKKRKLDDDTTTALVEAAEGLEASTRTAKRKSGPVTPTSNADEPAQRQKKAALARYECQQCGKIKLSRWFPDHTPTSTCVHTINTCTLCLKTWVNLQIANS
jgi:hypothetical protein